MNSRPTTWVMAGIFLGFSSILGLVVAVSMIGGTLEEESCTGGGGAFGPSAEALSDIPGNYLELYQQAATEYQLGGDGWSILAGVGSIETDHGRLDAPGVSSGENGSGAGGPMQFLQPTWDAYGVDGNGDGRKNRYDPRDAIPGAANYLKASGAPGDWRRALFAYNHADWYVNDVLSRAANYRGAALADPEALTRTSATGGGGGAILVEGDSLAVGTRAPLEALRSGVTTRAEGGRSSSQGVSDLRRVDDLPSTLVVQLGTNDTSVSTFRANVRAIKALPGVTRILWVNISRPPLGGTTDAELNAVLSDEADSRLQIIDWKSMVRGGGAELAGDRIHATGDGYRARARIIHQALGGATETAGRSSTGSSEVADDPSSTTGGGLLFPTRPGGPIIATPADHADRPLGNWMSDRAIDIAVPRGSDIIAVADGEIIRISGSAPTEGSGVIGGYGVTLRTANDTFWYGHLLRVDVNVGDSLSAGDVIGLSGYANGVDHLHLGVEHGDPMALFGEAEVAGPGDCAGGVPTGPANLGESVQVSQPREFAMLPAWAMAGGRSPQEIDARILPSALWLLQTYNLRVTAAREDGHQSHGDGTALDLVPNSPDWDGTAKRLSLDIGWTDECGARGTAPACPLKPWVRFVGYNGYPRHGDPQHAPGNAHLHISWQASGAATGNLSGPHDWIKTFPVPGEVED